MGNAIRDDNHIPVAVAVSSVDGETTIPIQINPATWAILAET